MLLPSGRQEHSARHRSWALRWWRPTLRHVAWACQGRRTRGTSASERASTSTQRWGAPVAAAVTAACLRVLHVYERTLDCSYWPSTALPHKVTVFRDQQPCLLRLPCGGGGPVVKSWLTRGSRPVVLQEEKWKAWRMYDYIVDELPAVLKENCTQVRRDAAAGRAPTAALSALWGLPQVSDLGPVRAGAAAPLRPTLRLAQTSHPTSVCFTAAEPEP